MMNVNAHWQYLQQELKLWWHTFVFFFFVIKSFPILDYFYRPSYSNLLLKNVFLLHEIIQNHYRTRFQNKKNLNSNSSIFSKKIVDEEFLKIWFSN